MACGCMKNKGWVYIDAEGNRFERRTEVEAMALYYRADGVGTVEPIQVPAKV